MRKILLASAFFAPLFFGAAHAQAPVVGPCYNGVSCNLGAITAPTMTLNGTGTALSVTTGYPLFGNGFTFATNTANPPSSPGSFHADSNWGGLFYALSGGAADFAILDSGGTRQFEVIKNSGVTIPISISSALYKNLNDTQTISGSSQLASSLTLGQNFAGSTTYTGNNYFGTIVSSSDNVALPASGALSMLAINDFMQGSATGSRIALNANLTPSASSSQPSGSDFIVISATINTSYSAGGTAAVPAGAQWGAVIQSELTNSAANYWGTLIGIEADCGVSVTSVTIQENVCQKMVNRSASGENASSNDAGLSFTSTNNNAGWLDVIEIGSYAYSSPVVSASYIMQAKYPFGPSGGYPTLAGGIDLRQDQFTGSGLVGGGFAWASPGSLIDKSGNLWADSASLVGSSTGATLVAYVVTLSGTPTVVAGGSNAAVGQPLADAYGDIVTVASVSSGAIATVSVLYRGSALSGALPANPVAFSCMPGSSAGACTGPVTFDLAWANVGGSSPVLTLGGVASVKIATSLTMPLNTGTPATYACFTSGGQLISSSTAC